MGDDFLRGDPQSDGTVEINDVLLVLAHLLIPGSDPPSCPDAGDVNDDGLLDIADAVYLLASLFVIGPPPLEPFPDCGPDPTPDDLGCSYSAVP